ncbi:hypothetical protein BDR03DRAFT_1014935 [Suillus americanus]|nr:hypothetical protein BDR03DRAFT_1014935 [Suillus americanus]
MAVTRLDSHIVKDLISADGGFLTGLALGYTDFMARILPDSLLSPFMLSSDQSPSIYTLPQVQNLPDSIHPRPLSLLRSPSPLLPHPPAVTPVFGRLAAVEARLKDEYRAGVGRLGRKSEEVARSPTIKHANLIYKIRIAYEWTEDFVIKYLWSAAGYGLIAVPLLIPRRHSRGAGAVDGEGKGKDLQETLHPPFNSTLYNLAPLLPALPADGDAFALRKQGYMHPEGSIYLSRLTLTHTFSSPRFHLQTQRTNPAPSETLSGPNTTALVRELTLTLRPGVYLIIAGSNGVGKTAVAHVFAGLLALGSRSILRGSMHIDDALTRPTDTISRTSSKRYVC